MSYELEIQKSFPVTVDTLNGSRPPLVAGSGSASLLSTSTPHAGFSGWVKGRENSPFSIEVWALPLTVSGTLLLIGHVAEGLFYDGTDYILRIEYATGVLEGRWKETEKKAHHFVMTYDVSAFSLYVDGERVITLDLPPGEQFLRTATQLNLNQTDGTGIYDSLATYYRVLPAREIKEHFALGRSARTSADIASSKGGDTWTLTYADVDVAQSIRYDSTNWDAGSFFQSSYTNHLRADLPEGGTWMIAVPLGAFDITTAGVHLTYVGEGVALSYSLDGVTWTIVPNKKTVLEDADTTDATLFVRIDLEDDTSWVESLTLDMLKSRAMQPFSGTRQLLFKSAAMDQTPGSQLEFQEDMGAQIRAGYLEVQTDPTPDTPRNVSTVELWAKLDDNDGFLLGATASNFVRITAGSLAATGFTVYRNGAAFPNGAVPTGQWDHYVLVSTSPITGVVRVGDKLSGGETFDLTVGHLATYEKAFTAGEAASLYSANVGAPALQIQDTGNISMSESATPTDIYAYVWSIVSGGN